MELRGLADYEGPGELAVKGEAESKGTCTGRTTRVLGIDDGTGVPKAPQLELVKWPLSGDFCHQQVRLRGCLVAQKSGCIGAALRGGRWCRVARHPLWSRLHSCLDRHCCSSSGNGEQQ